jgi:glyoxylase-like metal-dependent hydrolase (beta-lactamase superfamily II)
MPPVSGWLEVGADVFVRRYDPWDVNVSVVRGTDGLLVVDTRGSARQGRELLDDLAALGRPVRGVVNTHAHFDHSFGNQCFGAASALGVPIYAHRHAPAHLARYEAPLLAGWLDQDDVSTEELAEVEITPPDSLVDQHAVLDVGGRAVELVHLGRGHTDNDLLVHVGDADLWLAGDLVEESGAPMFGSGSFPLDWPETLSALHGRLGAATVVVPGHGRAVDAGFVAVQQGQLAEVARLVRELHAAGVPMEHAVAYGVDSWPFPLDRVAGAVADGYSQLAIDASLDEDEPLTRP